MKEKRELNHVALGGTDCLGRSLTPSGALPAKKQKLVGMFYFLSHDNESFPSTSVQLFEDTLAAYDIETLGSEASPFRDYEWGTSFYWGTPLFGCYKNDDEWVMRKHVEMLTNAGIDFLVFDTTNNRIFENAAIMMMRILDEGRKAGWETPKVAFYTNTDSGVRIKEIYDAIYARNLYPDTWFCMDGKPVMIGILDQTDPEIAGFFHFKNSVWPNSEYKDNGFPWIDFGWPQTTYATADDRERIVSVSVAQNSDRSACFSHNYFYGSDGCHGRSYHDGEAHITEDSYKYGYNFAEQWQGATDLDPDIVFVTGWNEWTAGVWTNDKPIAIFDCLDAEYSRDIEPMAGGFGDAYYMQLIDEVRKFKGIDKEMTAALPFAAQNYTTAKIQRKSDTFKGEITDDSIRNIITAVAVEEQGDSLVFAAETRDTIDETNRIGDWMRLLISTHDSNDFEYCFNLRADGKGKTVAARKQNGKWQRIGLIDYKTEGNRIALTVPRAMLGDATKINFKWVDSVCHCLKADDYYLHGSCAPLGALYYNITI